VTDVVQEVGFGFEHVSELFDRQIAIHPHVEGQLLTIAIDLRGVVVLIEHLLVVTDHGDRDVAVGRLPGELVPKSRRGGLARAQGNVLAHPGLFERVALLEFDDRGGLGEGLGRTSLGRTRSPSGTWGIDARSRTRVRVLGRARRAPGERTGTHGFGSTAAHELLDSFGLRARTRLRASGTTWGLHDCEVVHDEGKHLDVPDFGGNVGRELPLGDVLFEQREWHP